MGLEPQKPQFYPSADPDILDLIKTGAQNWNAARKAKPTALVNLSGLDLSGMDLSSFDLNEAVCASTNLTGANLRESSLEKAKLPFAVLNGSDLTGVRASGAFFYAVEATGAVFSEADLMSANFTNAHCRSCTFTSAILYAADLTETDLTRAILTGAVLDRVTFVKTKLDGAILRDCYVHGCAVWDVSLEGADQTNLVITDGGPKIQVDNLEVAQFLYLLLNNRKISQVIDTITSKVVLILGRFSEERKPILDAIRDELRKRDHLPVLFDFERPSSRDITETISILAHMARFVIADITDAKSIPQELMRIVPGLPSVPVQPLLLASQREYEMFEHFTRYPWVLDPYLYEDQEQLLRSLESHVIGPPEAETKVKTRN